VTGHLRILSEQQDYSRIYKTMLPLGGTARLTAVRTLLHGTTRCNYVNTFPHRHFFRIS